MDVVKIAKSAFGAAATGLSLSAALDSIFENVINPTKAGLAAAILAVVFAVKTAVVAKMDETKEMLG